MGYLCVFQQLPAGNQYIHINACGFLSFTTSTSGCSKVRANADGSAGADAVRFARMPSGLLIFTALKRRPFKRHGILYYNLNGTIGKTTVCKKVNNTKFGERVIYEEIDPEGNPYRRI